MIQLDTQSFSGQNIYSAARLLTFSVPASPAEHKVMVRLEVSYLQDGQSRDLRIVLCNAAQTIWYSVAFVEYAGDYDTEEPIHIHLGPFALDASDGLRVLISSDNDSDTSVTANGFLFSDDLEYYLSWRAAETSPTADSPTERLKAIDDKLPSASYLLGSSSASGQINAAAFAADVDAEMQSYVQLAIEANNLDHLMKVADDDDVVDNSVIAHLAAKGATADWSDFVNTTDSAQAVADAIAAIEAGTPVNVQVKMTGITIKN